MTVCNLLSGFYSINEYGEIISKKAGNRLAFKTDKDGYFAVTLCTNELISEKEHRRKTFRVACLVLREFGGDPPPTMIDPTVDHKDGNKKNNHISNLQWMERGKNSAMRKNKGVGEQNPSAKLSNKEAAEIKWLLENSFHTMAFIGKMYGVSKSTISNIKRKANWANIAPIQPKEVGF